MFGRVEVKIILTQIGDVHQAFGVNVVERDKDAKTRYAAHTAVKALADFVLHVKALQPVGDIARGFVGAAFGHRALFAECNPVARLVACFRQHRLDRAVHQQVRVAAYG